MHLDTIPTPFESSSSKEGLRKDFDRVTAKLASQVSHGYVGFKYVRDWVETHIQISSPVETNPHYINPESLPGYIDDQLQKLDTQLQVLGMSTQNTKIKERVQSGHSMKAEQEYLLFLHAKALFFYKSELSKPLPYNAFGPIREDESDNMFEHASNQLQQIREGLMKLFSLLSKRQ